MKTNQIIILLGVLGTTFPAAAFDFGKIDLNKAIETVKKVQKANTDINEPQEITLGQGIAGSLLGAAPLLDNPPVQEYVNRVGRWLTLQTERPDLPWQFGVLDDNDVNAFSAPGGYVFITKGLLAQMNSEAELAGVLAHEISHVLRKHHLQAIKKSARTELLADLANDAIKNNGKDPRLTKLVSAGTEVYARGLDKKDEFEADRMGVVIAARGGYDPYGLPAVLQTLESLNPSDSSVALMFKTHPALADRLSVLDQEMSGQFTMEENQPDLAPRFFQALGAGKK
ncbi:MAG: M48 family metalloprotease [Gammaproteobacteria bacterium]|nr:M48 family metalloprotease [Gammaproteobacteria bacterium]MBU1480157.1 M48 family metalloprotease [Gammaproteobacteria bacterium]